MKNIILTKKEISLICKKLGKQIDDVIKNDSKPPLLVGVLKGAVPFLVDLSKNIKSNIFVDYIQIKSYSGTSTTGNVNLLRDVSFDCENRTVIIVEDIIDTGYSMNFLLQHFKSHNPKNVYVCALFDKVHARKVAVKVDFVGKVLEKNDFLLGYGLDYCELGRNLPYVIAATSKDINKLDKKLTEKRFS